MSNRAQRRAQARAGGHVELVRPLVLPLSTAIELNTERPIPGLGRVLYEIRADAGTDVWVSICPECQGVEVLG